jgi:hypothetical protein
MTMARTCTARPYSWTPEESEVEGYEDQDNANIHCQPFPESVSEEREIYTDDDGYHRRPVKDLDSDLNSQAPDERDYRKLRIGRALHSKYPNL